MMLLLLLMMIGKQVQLHSEALVFPCVLVSVLFISHFPNISCHFFACTQDVYWKLAIPSQSVGQLSNYKRY